MSCCVCMPVSFLLPPLLLVSSSSSSLSSQMWHINKKVMVPSHMFNVMPNGGMVIPCLLTDHLHNDKKIYRNSEIFLSEKGFKLPLL